MGAPRVRHFRQRAARITAANFPRNRAGARQTVICYPGRMSDEGHTGRGGSAAETLGALAAALRDCQGCRLSKGRTHVVFGVGSADADLMFVGEGPGFHEDRQGEPFVGQAGKLLTELLAGIGLTREDVYIANVVKCRPPENRDPEADEIEACSPHLMQQIAIIRPRVICTLGRFATRLLAGTELSMGAIHGRAKECTLAGTNTLIFPVFHPAAALYAPANRQVLEEDFGKLRALLERGVHALSPPAGAPEEPGAPASSGWPGGEPPAGGRRSGTDRTEQLHLW